MARGRSASPKSLAILSVVLAVVAGGWLALAPCATQTVTESVPATSDPGAATLRAFNIRCESLLESEGPGMLALFAIPVGLSVLALQQARTRRSVMWPAVLLLVFCVLSVLSVGLFFLPAAIAALLAALAPNPVDPVPA